MDDSSSEEAVMEYVHGQSTMQPYETQEVLDKKRPDPSGSKPSRHADPLIMW